MWYVKVHRQNNEKDSVAIIFDPFEKKLIQHSKKPQMKPNVMYERI